MTETPHKSDEQEEKQFGIHPDSIDAKLHRLPKPVQERYRRNRRQFEAEQTLLLAWARAGFVADGGLPEQEQGVDA